MIIFLTPREKIEKFGFTRGYFPNLQKIEMSVKIR